MNVRFLPHEQTQSTLVALIESCESMQWAVAWATENAVFEKAMKHSGKFGLFDDNYLGRSTTTILAG